MGGKHRKTFLRTQVCDPKLACFEQYNRRFISGGNFKTARKANGRSTWYLFVFFFYAASFES